MTGKHARLEPGMNTEELELRFPAHRRHDDAPVDAPRASAPQLEDEEVSVHVAE